MFSFITVSFDSSSGEIGKDKIRDGSVSYSLLNSMWNGMYTTETLTSWMIIIWVNMFKSTCTCRSAIPHVATDPKVWKFEQVQGLSYARPLSATGKCRLLLCRSWQNFPINFPPCFIGSITFRQMSFWRALEAQFNGRLYTGYISGTKEVRWILTSTEHETTYIVTITILMCN